MSEIEPRDDAEVDGRLRSEGERWRAARAGCPTPDMLLARRSESLDEDVRRRLGAHLAGCEDCTRLVRDFEELRLDEPGAALEERVLSRVFASRRSRWAPWMGLAAAVVLASGFAAVWWARSRPAPDPASATTRAAVEHEAAPIVALWSIEPAPVRVPLSSLGVPRSGNGASGSRAAALIDALAPYQAGDYAGAISGLERVVRDHPADPEGFLYLGVSHLMAGRAAEAINPLETARALAPANRRDEIDWYLATAEQRAGNADASRGRLRALCAGGGAFRSAACAAEATLK